MRVAKLSGRVFYNLGKAHMTPVSSGSCARSHQQAKHFKPDPESDRKPSGGGSEQEENGNLSIPLKMHIGRLPEKDSRLSAGLHPALTQAVLTSCGCVTALHPPQDTLPLHPLGSAS